jgi:tetratricopeptide (TPR) repeat protein
MNWHETADRKLRRIAHWTAVALSMGSVLLPGAEVRQQEDHYQTARAALVKGDTTKAKRELKLSLQENPLHAEAHFLLASLLGRDGDLDQAAVGYQETVKLEPNNAVARYNLGTTMLQRGETLSAARLFEEAVIIRPDYVPTYNNLAKAYFLAGIPELSVASYQEALRRDPSNPIARKGLTLLTQAGSELTGSGSSADEAKPLVNHTLPVAPDQAAAEPGVDDAEVHALRELVRDLSHVTAERRGDRLTLGGWTSGVGERKVLDRILVSRTNALDLTTDDAGDPHELLEVDAILFHVIGLDSKSVGHDFLRRVTVNASVADAATAGFSWLYSAAISYEVNIANATQERVAFLARPHLTTLSGTPATFIAGGDTVYKVSGTTSGDIKSYPFGTSLDITPTVLRTRAADGTPRVRMVVKAGRKSVLTLDSPEAQATGSSVYANVSVTSEAVLDLNQTLILTGLSQREQTISRSGIPGLMSIPIIKYLVSERKTITSDLAIIILLTPREPAFWDEQNHQALAAFVEKRRAYVQASQGTPEDMQRFKERYPDWNKLAPNRFASHFFLMENSEVYRRLSGTDLGNESLDFDILGKTPKNKAKLQN